MTTTVMETEDLGKDTQDSIGGLFIKEEPLGSLETLLMVSASV